MIRTLQETTGGFGVVLGFAHDWANREATLRSWDLFARYVIPELHGRDARTSGRRSSYLHDNQAELMGGASRAVMSKIMATRARRRRWPTTMEQMAARRPPTTRRSAPAPACRPPTATERPHDRGVAPRGRTPPPRRGRR